MEDSKSFENGELHTCDRVDRSDDKASYQVPHNAALDIKASKKCEEVAGRLKLIYSAYEKRGRLKAALKSYGERKIKSYTAIPLFLLLSTSTLGADLVNILPDSDLFPDSTTLKTVILFTVVMALFVLVSNVIASVLYKSLTAIAERKADPRLFLSGMSHSDVKFIYRFVVKKLDAEDEVSITGKLSVPIVGYKLSLSNEIALILNRDDWGLPPVKSNILEFFFLNTLVDSIKAYDKQAELLRVDSYKKSQQLIDELILGA